MASSYGLKLEAETYTVHVICVTAMGQTDQQHHANLLCTESSCKPTFPNHIVQWKCRHNGVHLVAQGSRWPWPCLHSTLCDLIQPQSATTFPLDTAPISPVKSDKRKPPMSVVKVNVPTNDHTQWPHANCHYADARSMQGTL